MWGTSPALKNSKFLRNLVGTNYGKTPLKRELGVHGPCKNTRLNCAACNNSFQIKALETI
jgi:hypothetical protein